MNLNDLQHPMSAAALARLLKKHHGITIPVDQLNEQQIRKMLKKVQKTLNEFRNTTQYHQSLKDQNYTALLLTEKTLQAKAKQLNEGKIGSALSDAGEKLSYHLPKKYYGPTGTSLSKLKSQFSRDSSSAPSSSPSKFKLTSQSEVPNYAVKAAMDRAKKNPDQISPNDAKVFYKLVKNQVESDQLSLYESRKLYESAMADAEVVLAAKDIADRFQDMVESLGKMINEEMPALVETIRDTMGAEQADAYNSSATQTVNSALENIRSAKEALDSAARTLAGEEAGAQPIEEPFGDEEVTGDELDQVPAAASGGEEEPLGRGER